MTLVAGRMPSLHTLERNRYGDDVNMQGILKSGPTRKLKTVRTEVKYIDKQVDHNQRNEDGKRLVRFCETEDSEKQQRGERDTPEAENVEVIRFGNNMYYINSSDPNSAVRKLFPNSKLTPINPFVNRPSVKDNRPNQSHSKITNMFENNRNVFNRTKSKSDNEDLGKRDPAKKKIERNVLRRNFQKAPPETKPKPGRNNEASTPLIDRIKQLTCDNDDANERKPVGKESTLPFRNLNGLDSKQTYNIKEEKPYNHFQVKDLPKQAKEGLNLLRYNQNILQARSLQNTEKKSSSPNSTNVTDEARRSFLSSLSKEVEGDPGDRTSVATSSTTGDTVYSLSDIEEALTEEEKEITEAFSHEIKQDELELFVQQDAGRTERLRKRYSSTPKPENPTPVMFAANNYPTTLSNLSVPHFINGSCNTIKKDKPKFGSTIEILQQLQQQIETPYQLEGRRTACSNYSDSSIPISERFFCDESSDGYEPVLPKLNVHRTCSLDSKNYEEIDNYPSAFSVPRTKSHEHPRLAHLESEPYFYPPSSARYPGNFLGRNHSLEPNIYASSPDLHGHHHMVFPDRVSSYNSHTANTRQLHPVLQKQYCRYPVNSVSPRPVEEGKVLTPPSRMHTYMNVPTNAPCYLSPPPYSKANHYKSPPEVYHYDPPYNHSNIYQNIPLPLNPHVMNIRRLCTERERGVPEGASSSHSSEIYPMTPKDFYFPPNIATIPKPSSVPHHYCVDV